jgi:uroporphyrinogen decarboxylase
MNTRFHNALNGKAQDIPPVWFMRQAGRYHRHYQALRKQHGFMELCKDPKLAAEVALGPVQDFDFDVAILFSDLLFPLEALGMGLTYDPSPKLGWHLSESSVKKLRPWKDAVSGVAFQKEAVIETRKVLPKDKSLIGFVGGPWTLYTYAVEGEHKGNLISAKTQISLFHKFCESLVPLLEANIQLQLEGGAEVVMLFDTAAGELSPLVFKQEVQKYMKHLAKKYPGKLGYYSKGTTHGHLTDLRQDTAFAGFGVDHRFDLPGELKSQPHGFLQGNFDQALLFCAPKEFQARLDAYLQPFLFLTPEQRRYWVSGLGHGVLPETPEENVRQFVRHIRDVFSREVSK